MSTLALPETELEASQAVVGKIKSFGIGPKYEVIRPIRQLIDGDWLMEISLIEAEETVEYLLSDINADPEAL